jgi:hypothetical protein
MNTPRKDPDDSSRRQKCERWGVVYASDPTSAMQPFSFACPAEKRGQLFLSRQSSLASAAAA